MMAVHQANTEPLPGYRLLEPLGHGGFGEVWKCEAPGGLLKAIKFVAGRSRQVTDEPCGATQELRALQQIKTIHHPFLLSLDRVEVVNDDLIIVMELAECSLHDLLTNYHAQGQPGIPREELICYLHETAEVLDLMNQQHNLQHLDIKPRNLFLVAGHVKVADFGLVNSVAELNGSEPAALQLGMITPVYAAPESFLGKISPFSDQYSLAITYHELLTGKTPFTGKNFRQLAMQHMQAIPDLHLLPEDERSTVARALAKEPRDRFPSCTAFVRSLVTGMTGSSEMRVPARMYFALESSPKHPKLPTAHDFKGGDTGSTATVATVRPQQIPSASEFAGLRLVECLSRQPNGELWRGLAQDGRKRLVRFVFDVDDARAEGDPFERLGQLLHPNLAKLEVLREGPNRVGLVTETGDDNLGTRLKECMQAGMPGIPRSELLTHLSGIAAALDALFDEHRLLHLTLSPRTVALVGGKARLMDFGLAELFWLPCGQQAGSLNTRYAAPELFDGQLSRNADQYSLALIFQEMLTGVHGFRNLNPRQMASARQRGNPDLGMMPATDRVLLLRALHTDPDRRFPTNTDFIEALVAATVRSKTAIPVLPGRKKSLSSMSVVAPSRQMPVVVVSSTLAINELVGQAAVGREVRERGGMRFLLTPGVSLIHHCCARMIPSVIPLKLAGFREQWNGRLVEHDEEKFLYHVPLPGPIWRRVMGSLPSLAVEVCCEFPEAENQTVTEATIQIWPLDCNKAKGAEILEEMGPRVLESARTFLNAHPERRSQVRLPFEHTVQVAPLFDGEVGEPILSKTRDISPRGMSVLMPCRPLSAEVRVLVTLPSRRDPAAINGRVMRVRGCKDGRFEIGLAFV